MILPGFNAERALSKKVGFYRMTGTPDSGRTSLEVSPQLTNLRCFVNCQYRGGSTAECADLCEEPRPWVWFDSIPRAFLGTIS
jgi:hypothetical protein